jgi:hypothetical protein
LKAEVSVLSPRVAFLDHQRLLLNVDNSALKQRIAALAQDKILKDGNLIISSLYYFFNYLNTLSVSNLNKIWSKKIDLFGPNFSDQFSFII